MKSFKVLIKIILTAVLAYSFQSSGPWWTVAVAGFLISFIVSSDGLSSFIGGFFGVALLWFIASMYIDISTESILTDRVAGIFSLPDGGLLIVITTLVGGLTGGMGALTGSHLRNLVMPPKYH